MAARKRAVEDKAAQSARFIEAAKQAEADKSGRKFARVFEKIAKAKPRSIDVKRK